MNQVRDSQKPRLNVLREELSGRLLKLNFRPFEGGNNQQICTAICFQSNYITSKLNTFFRDESIFCTSVVSPDINTNKYYQTLCRFSTNTLQTFLKVSQCLNFLALYTIQFICMRFCVCVDILLINPVNVGFRGKGIFHKVKIKITINLFLFNNINCNYASIKTTINYEDIKITKILNKYLVKV